MSNWLKRRKRTNRVHFTVIFTWNFVTIKSNYFKRISVILPSNALNIHGKRSPVAGEFFKILLHAKYTHLKTEQLIFCRQPEVAARKLGINSSFIKGDYCYVLVRVSRFRETARLMKPIPANQRLHEDVSEKIQNMTPGNSTETIQFMTNFGTHYINSYVTGNSLYQVKYDRWSSNHFRSNFTAS